MPPYTTGMRTRACDVFDKVRFELNLLVSLDFNKVSNGIVIWQLSMIVFSVLWINKQAVDLYRQICEEKKKDGIQVDKEAVALHL